MHHLSKDVTHSLITPKHTMDAIVASLFTNQAVITTTFKWKPKTFITIKKKKNPSSSSNVICFSSLTPQRPHHINHTHPYFYKNQKKQFQRTLPPPPLPLSPLPPPPQNPSEHTTSLLETFNQTQILRNLLTNLQTQNSNPLQILKNDDDWTKEQFWLVVKYLKETSRANEIIQVFDMWKNIEESRINEMNYKDIIRLLSEVGLVEEAVSLLREMRTYDLNPSVPIYNFIINGFARKGDTDSALKFLEEMKENNLKPKTETFHELIRFYGNSGMYDEMGTYVKKIESEGCSPDHMTYNLLVMGFAQGGLLKRMERAYRTLLSKRMELKYPAVIAMLEAYANLEILDKLDEVFQRVSRSKIMLREDTVRKVAGVYIKNYMFSKLDGLGNHVAVTTGRTELVWCLRLLSQGCQFSKRGMEYVVQDMEEANFCWTPTVLNIFALTYLKMGDLKFLRGLLSHLQKLKVRPDIVTAGVLFDAIPLGFDAKGVLEIWKRMGYLDQTVDMITDPLVLSAFKKGRFLRNCEEKYTSMGPEVRKISVWTYQDLITMVLQNK